MALSYDKIKKIAMIIHYICAGALLLNAFGTWGYNKFTKIDFILCFYYILFAVIIVFTELRLKVPFFQKIIGNIGYMKYNFGKFGNLMFLFFIGIGRFAFSIIAVIIHISAAIFFIVIAFLYKTSEATELNEEEGGKPAEPNPLAAKAPAQPKSDDGSNQGTTNALDNPNQIVNRV